MKKQDIRVAKMYIASHTDHVQRYVEDCQAYECYSLEHLIRWTNAGDALYYTLKYALLPLLPQDLQAELEKLLTSYKEVQQLYLSCVNTAREESEE